MPTSSSKGWAELCGEHMLRARDQSCLTALHHLHLRNFGEAQALGGACLGKQGTQPHTLSLHLCPLVRGRWAGAAGSEPPQSPDLPNRQRHGHLSFSNFCPICPPWLHLPCLEDSRGALFSPLSISHSPLPFQLLSLTPSLPPPPSRQLTADPKNHRISWLEGHPGQPSACAGASVQHP